MAAKPPTIRTTKAQSVPSALYLRTDKGSARLAAAHVIATLDKGARATSVLAEHLTAPANKKDWVVWIEAGTCRVGPFTVVDYDLPREHDGGRLTLAEPALAAAPFHLELFPAGKTSYGDAISTRIPDIAGTKDLFSRKHPALAVDVPVAALLCHVGAENGWHWRRARSGKLLLAPLDEERPKKVQGVNPSDRSAGCRFELTSPRWPLVGEAVESDHASGSVLEIELVAQPGQACRCFVTVGQAGVLHDAEPAGSRHVPAVVAKLDPFEVTVERRGRKVRTPARLMFPTADGGKCQIEWPVVAGDVGTLVVPSGGVSTSLPEFYPESAGKPAKSATVRADTWVGRFKKLVREADEADDKIASYTVKTRGMSIDRMS